MIRKQTLFVVLLGVLSLIMIVSCNKTLDNEEIVDVYEEQSISLPENMSIASIRLKDTINNIRGMVSYAGYPDKSKTKIDMKVANECWQNDLRAFTKQIKGLENMDRTDTNYYNIKVRSVYYTNKLVSVLYDKHSHISGKKDTISEILTVNYDRNTGEIKPFNKFFKVNKDNLTEFNKIFSSNFTLNDLQNLSYNIEKGIISINYNDGKKVYRYIVKQKYAKKFTIDD